MTLETNQVTVDGRRLHDKDGMTPERAELLVAQVVEWKAVAERAFLAGDAATLAHAKQMLEAINVEARRLNKVRQQKIVGFMGRKPADWDETHG